MGLIKSLLRKTEKIDFLFPNDFDQLMKDDYFDYDKFEWFLYYVFKLEGTQVTKVGKKGQGDGGADLIVTIESEKGYNKRIGIQAKYWKNKVGTGPINQLASAKARHSLSDLWIITTSDLTSDAKEIAESLDIKILRAVDVKQFIETVKSHHKKYLDDEGESPITFLPIKKKEEKPKKPKTKLEDSDDLREKLRKLRITLSGKYKLKPVYNVFNNVTLDDLLLKKPKNIKELSEIIGLGEKKITTFGEEIINFFKESDKADNKENLEEQLYNFLIEERVKISKFNKLTVEDVYSDRVASNLAKMKPRDKETLARVYGFKKENIEIFGEYLIRIISNFLDSRK